MYTGNACSVYLHIVPVHSEYRIYRGIRGKETEMLGFTGLSGTPDLWGTYGVVRGMLAKAPAVGYFKTHDEKTNDR